jgi:hypothetical protein
MCLDKKVVAAVDATPADVQASLLVGCLRSA